MHPSADWTTEFYRDEQGGNPVEAFLDRLDLKTRARFRWSMEQLRLRNVQAREPLVRQLERDLWELREASSTNIYRVIYFFFTGRRIIFLHGFQKQTQRTPSGEIELARRRQQAFLATERAREEAERRRQQR
jgi:phage-related protein